jgi:hypothetical protein
VRRQTIIWRQLLAGDKEPEAYLDRDARSELRDELRHLIWRRYRTWLLPLSAALFTFVVAFPHVVSLYEKGIVRPGLASALVAVTGALGITKASVLFAVRGRLDQWSQLLWNRALAQKVVDNTLTLDSVIPPAPAQRRFHIGVPSRFARPEPSTAWREPAPSATVR